MAETTETTRAAIVGLLNAVPGIGVVHAYERYAAKHPELRALYVVQTGAGTEQLRGWYVRRLSFRVERDGMDGRRVFTTWLIRGVMALQDSTQSELEFDALVDSIRRAFEDDATLGGAVTSTLTPDGEIGAQLTGAGPVMFAGVLCHAADLTLTTETWEES
ncbi:hypothetical protein CEW87_03935 [Parazoarcus communis]|uniref:Uncharacterized protein n=1 Tax=Parazoarcus communis TaxID=41977 RepID=A0A2U8GZ34_9RHOO|nr:hypothetical protein [Parazoarcus communis]AWI78583.1 hypothetical protein CEW87_03935 [Parazoarcus communis]